MKHDSLIRSEVKLAEHLRTEDPVGVCVQAFENGHRERTMHAILTQLGADRSGMLLEDQKRQARIILYGHSRSGSAMVELARKLEKSRILELLAVQVDGLRRSGVDDRVIPPNIARAANGDPPDGMVHEEIRAADPSEILANFCFEYKQHPIHCPEYPWYDWSFAKTHTQVACDPAVWSRVEAPFRQQIAPASAKQDRVYGYI